MTERYKGTTETPRLDLVLGAAVAQIRDALEAHVRAVIEEQVPAIVREELARGGTGRDTARVVWMSPPACAKALRERGMPIGVKKITGLIRAGAIHTRARNVDVSRARQIKRLVNIDEVVAALAEPKPVVVSAANQPSAPTSAAEWAQTKMGNRR